ncbi:MAG: sugar transferase [Rhodobacteraceae bacterium]|jgi:lipopolysaccharide/colanic/teichoic acid biosynthesis glycosyltransferase|nr:sugar transferase [Paracoccaceae bacterium]
MTLSKRLFDLSLALLLTLLLALPTLGLCLWLLATSGRPLLYLSERMKGPDQPFLLWKFRTMTVETGDSGVSGADKAMRITPAGRILRRYRLDEIPQLWNILKGDMSFVGPRPPLRQYVERFPALYTRVLQSRPGLTGLATLRYHRHEERLLARSTSREETDLIYSRACVPRKARLDTIYQEKQTLCFDIAIVIETAMRVLRRD